MARILEEAAADIAGFERSLRARGRCSWEVHAAEVHLPR